MHTILRRSALGCVSLLSFLAFAGPVAHSQGNGPKDGPPNVLVIQREYLKPGKGGTLHERSESAFVKAAKDANYPTHYFALDSMSGPTRALFVFSYDSFADWEKDNLATQKNKTLSAAIDHATLMDGDLLSSYDTTALMLRPDLSLNSIGLNGVRYFEISSFYVKPGKEKEWEEAAKMYRDAFGKIPGAHWDVFQVVYGLPQGSAAGSAYLVVTLMKSLSETDKGMQDEMKFASDIGPGGMRKLSELVAESTNSWTTNLFAINPRMSYPAKEWVDNEPAFWKPAQMPMGRKKPAQP